MIFFSYKQMLLEPIESSNTQMFFQMLHFFLDHKDRYHVTNGKFFKKECIIFLLNEFQVVHVKFAPFQ